MNNKPEQHLLYENLPSQPLTITNKETPIKTTDTSGPPATYFELIILFLQKIK